MRDMVKVTSEMTLRWAWFIPVTAGVCKLVSPCPWFWLCFFTHQCVSFAVVAKTCRKYKNSDTKMGSSENIWTEKESCQSPANATSLSLCTFRSFLCSFVHSFIHSHTGPGNTEYCMLILWGVAGGERERKTGGCSRRARRIIMETVVKQVRQHTQ